MRFARIHADSSTLRRCVHCNSTQLTSITQNQGLGRDNEWLTWSMTSWALRLTPEVADSVSRGLAASGTVRRLRDVLVVVLVAPAAARSPSCLLARTDRFCSGDVIAVLVLNTSKPATDTPTTKTLRYMNLLEAGLRHGMCSYRLGRTAAASTATRRQHLRQ